MRILSIVKGIIASDWIRIIYPFAYLRENGIQAAAIQESDLPRLKQRGWPKYDMFVMARRVPGEAGIDAMLALIDIERARGVKIVYEIDDDPFSTRFHKNPDDIKAILSRVDAVVAATRPLANRVSGHAPTYVFQNYVNLDLWPRNPVQFPGQEITIGIQGSSTHYDDWKIVDEPLHEIARRHPNVSFVTFGYTPDYLSDLPRLKTIEPVPYFQYPQHLQFDIGLAPLIEDDEGFNLCKSPIKAIDYMAAGIATVASDHPVYRQVDGIRRVRDDEWFDTLEHLVTHPHEIHALKQRGHKWVKRNRTLRTGWKELAGIYRKILQGASE